MKMLILGLDSATPELLFGDEELLNIRQLMRDGCHGTLESINPPITVPAWMSLATAQDPGTLGVYGFRNRRDYSYANLDVVSSKSIRAHSIWDQVGLEGGRASILGVPPNFPPRKTSGLSVGCFLTPDTSKNDFTHPREFGLEIRELLGNYPVDVHGFRTDRKDWLKDRIYSTSRKQFELLRHVMRSTEWDFLQFVEMGLDRIQHGFWRYHDPLHRHHEPGNPYQHVIRDYYRHLDFEIGRILKLVDEDTAVLIASDHGAKRLDGGFCINEWLIREGYLKLHRYPDQVTNLSKLDVDWEQTTAWGEGGYYARVCLNVHGREPSGVVHPDDFGKVRDELVARLEAVTDDEDQPLETTAYKPDAIYQTVHNVAPDLIVHFGNLSWRSIGGVGYSNLHVIENDDCLDDCNHAQFGSLVLSAPGSPLEGEVHGVHLLHIAPTLLEMAGYDVPSSMAASPVGMPDIESTFDPVLSESDEQIVRQRLTGLGYF